MSNKMFIGSIILVTYFIQVYLGNGMIQTIIMSPYHDLQPHPC